MKLKLQNALKTCGLGDLTLTYLTFLPTLFLVRLSEFWYFVFKKIGLGNADFYMFNNAAFLFSEYIFTKDFTDGKSSRKRKIRIRKTTKNF